MPPRFIPPDPEEEAQRQWAIDHPWERPTFAVPPPRDFQREDWAETYEKANALNRNNQVREYFNVDSAGVDPNSGEATTALGSRLANRFTPEQISEKTWGEFQKRWGVAPTNNWNTYKTPGGGVVGVDPHTGKSAQLVPDGPPKAVTPKPEQKFRIPVAFDPIFKKPTEFVQMTEKELREKLPTLSDSTRSSETVKAIMGAISPEAPTVNLHTNSFSPKLFTPPKGGGKPSRAVAREYVGKFGQRATEQLKADGYDPSGYAD